MFGPFRSFFRYYGLCWLLAVRCYYAFFSYDVYLNASARPPRVLTRFFPPSTCHIYPQAIPCSYWALTYLGALPSLGALYVISARQARGLPLPFSRFHLTMDTLDLGYLLPSAGPIRVLHPLERALTGRTKQNRHDQNHACSKKLRIAVLPAGSFFPSVFSFTTFYRSLPSATSQKCLGAL